jgi:hypothetical protein
MFYSKFDPVRGHYDYFETADALAALNDDLPVPKMPSATDIGVPSVECGRPLPAAVWHVGTGELSRGHIAPPDSARLSGVIGATEPGTSSMLFSFLAGAASIVVLWMLVGRKR